MPITTKIVREDDEGFSYTFEPIEDTIIKTKTDAGYEIRYLVRDDEGGSSPSDNGDDNLFLVNYHRDFWVTKDEIITKDDVISWYRLEGCPQSETYWIYVLASYNHSGTYLYLGGGTPACDPGGWDTSHVGLVLVSKEEWPEEEAAKKAAQGLVEYWNQYLTGDVYGCVVEKFNNAKEPVEHDAVWGYFGMENAKVALENDF